MTTDDDRVAYLARDEVPAEDVARAEVGEPSGRDVDEPSRVDLDATRALLRDPSVWVEAGADLEERVVRAIAAESSSVPSLPPVPVRAPGVNRRRHRWGWVAAAAAAAAVVGGVAVVSLRGGPEPERLAAVLMPTDLLPAASGHAELTHLANGWRIDLDATGLPRLYGGRFYQGWLKDEAGTLVPIGTFNEGPRVTLWAGVSPHAFPTVTITEEAADGDQGSSGRRVLVGTVVIAGD